MSNRIKMLVICLISLISGVVIYTYFRTDTHIGNFLGELFGISPLAANSLAPISYYLPDFLWAFSLCCGLFAAYPLRKSLVACWGIVTFLYGVLWETAQHFSIISGTSDIIDVIMYFMAATAAVIINLYYIKEKQK